jgi:hypothetical protein
MTINPLGGPQSISFSKSTYGTTTLARPTPTTVSTSQHPFVEASDASTSALLHQQHYPVQPPASTSDSNAHTFPSQLIPDFPTAPAFTSTRGTRSRSVSAVSNTSSSNPAPASSTPQHHHEGRNSSPSLAVQTPGNLPSPPDSDHSPSRGSGSRIPKPVRSVNVNGGATGGSVNGRAA